MCMNPILCLKVGQQNIGGRQVQGPCEEKKYLTTHELFAGLISVVKGKAAWLI